MTKSELRKLLLKWKTILRLQDWDINIAIVDQSYIDDIANAEDMPYQADALNKICSIKKRCEILISSTASESIEKCLVHELVHLLVNTMDQEHRYAIGCITDSSLRSFCEERRINPLEQTVNEITRICICNLGEDK